MIRIVTDSASDIEQGRMENLSILPLKVNIDEKTYRDGVDMSKDEFFDLLESSDVLPSTSLATPFEFETVYKEITDRGDEAIVLPLSSSLSGTCESAMIAAADYENISVVDTRSVSFGQTLLVQLALDLVKEGKSREEIVRVLEEEKKKIRFYAIVDTLKYLEKGGRLSKGAALVGGLIGIKPILAIEDGALVPLVKARGARAAYRKLTEMVKESNINNDRPIFMAYSGTTDGKLQAFLSDGREVFDELMSNVDFRQLGSAVGTHAGPDAIVVTYFTK